MKRFLFLFVLCSLQLLSLGQVKISEMPAATSVGSSDIVPLLQGGVNKKATVGLFPFVAQSRTITINGVSYDLSQNRSWTISGAGGASSLTGLSDVSVSSPSLNQVLRYNGSAWVNATAATYNLTSPQDGQVLKYSAGTFVNGHTADSIQVSSSVPAHGNFYFNPSDTSLNVKWGGSWFSFKQNGSGSSGGAGYETEFNAYFARVEAAGGTLTTAHKDAINTFVAGLKSAGLYSKLTEMWLFVGGNAASQALGFKNAHNLTFSGTWLHAPTGVAGDGTAAYANTGLVPSAELALNDQHLSIWSRTNAALAGTTTDFGARNGAPYEANVLSAGYGTNYNFATAQLGEVPDGGNPQYTYSTTQGWWLASRTSSSGSVLYRNGASVATGSLASSGQATVPLYIGAMNQSGTGATVWSNREYAFASAGSGLSSSEASSFYSLLNTLMTALGR